MDGEAAAWEAVNHQIIHGLHCRNGECVAALVYSGLQQKAVQKTFGENSMGRQAQQGSEPTHEWTHNVDGVGTRECQIHTAAGSTGPRGSLKRSAHAVQLFGRLAVLETYFEILWAPRGIMVTPSGGFDF